MEQQHPNGDSTSVYPIGSINVRAILHETHLRVELLNARHLKPLETQKGQKGSEVNNSVNNASKASDNATVRSRALAACLSAPDESLQYHESNYSSNNVKTTVKNENNINEVSFCLPLNYELVIRLMDIFGKKE